MHATLRMSVSRARRQPVGVVVSPFLADHDGALEAADHGMVANSRYGLIVLSQVRARSGK